MVLQCVGEDDSSSALVLVVPGFEVSSQRLCASCSLFRGTLFAE
jgi:hypothetical protein